MKIVNLLFKRIFHKEISDFKEQIRNKDIELNKRNREISLLNSNYEYLQEECKAQKSKIEKIDTEIIRLNINSKNLRQTCEDYKRIVEDKETEINRLKNNTVYLQQEYESQKIKTEIKDNHIKELNEILTTYKKQILEVKQKNEENYRYIEDIKTECEKKEEEVSFLENRNITLVSELDISKASLKEAHLEIEKLSEANNSLSHDQLELIESLNLIREMLNVKERMIKDLQIESKHHFIAFKKEEGYKKALQDDIYKLAGLLSKKERLIISLQSQSREREPNIVKQNLKKEERDIKLSDFKNIGSREKDTEQRIQTNFENSKNEETDSNQRGKFRKLPNPYWQSQQIPKIIKETVDFPKIENENIYSDTVRVINYVFDHRVNKIIKAKDIFFKKSVEEISLLRFQLEEAIRTGKPYLSCPSCGNLLKISSRSIGFGKVKNEIQYFSHAVRNLPCDLKREVSSEVNIDNGYYRYDASQSHTSLRDLLAYVLNGDTSRKKGVSDIERNVYVSSDNLPLMKRRLADVVAKYNDLDLVFEIVAPTTNIAMVHDKDLFYLINKKQVFWVFGLHSLVNYEELSRSISKDICFTNKRNVFVFDLEAQLESERCGELKLKCNWLDEDGNWHFQVKRNGKNGILLSIDEIKFDTDSCRPYYYDADKEYFRKYPYAERPLRQSREDLINEIKKSWENDLRRKSAIDKMQRENSGVQCFYDGNKWGIKFEDVVFIEAIFDSQPIILGNFAKVERNNKFGVIDRYGSWQLQTDYDYIELLSNDQILYSSEGKWKLFKESESLAPKYSSDEVIIDTLSVSGVKSSIHLTILRKNHSNRPVVELYFLDNNIIKKDIHSGKWQLWKSFGIPVEGVLWDNFALTSENNVEETIDNETYIFDSKGSILISTEYSEHGNKQLLDSVDQETKNDDSHTECFSEIPIFQENKEDNNIEDKSLYSENLYEENLDGGTIINTSLQDKEDKFKELEVEAFLPDECIITKRFMKFGLEQAGRILIQHVYDKLERWIDDKYIAVFNGKYGIISINNQILLDFHYSFITPLVNEYSVVRTVNSIFEIDQDLNRIINIEYGYKKIMVNGKWGITDEENKTVVEFIYDEIFSYKDHLMGIINEALVDLKIFYPYKLSFTATNQEKSKDGFIVTVGGVSFRKIRNNKESHPGMDEAFLLNKWNQRKLSSAISISEVLSINTDSQIVDKDNNLELGISYNVMVIDVWKNILNKGINQIVVADENYYKWIIDYGQIENVNRVSHKFQKFERLKITKIGFDSVKGKSKWRIDKVFRKRFVNYSLGGK